MYNRFRRFPFLIAYGETGATRSRRTVVVRDFIRQTNRIAWKTIVRFTTSIINEVENAFDIYAGNFHVRMITRGQRICTRACCDHDQNPNGFTNVDGEMLRGNTKSWEKILIIIIMIITGRHLFGVEMETATWEKLSKYNKFSRLV